MTQNVFIKVSGDLFENPAFIKLLKKLKVTSKQQQFSNLPKIKIIGLN